MPRINRRLVAFLVALVVLVAGAVFSVWYLFGVTPLSSVEEIRLALFGDSHQYVEEMYYVEGQPIKFGFSIELMEAVPEVTYSSAFQEFLDGLELDLAYLKPEVQTEDTLPKKVKVIVTEGAAAGSHRITYDNDKNPLYSYLYSYDDRKGELTIEVFISEAGTHLQTDGGSGVPMEIIVNQRILVAIGQFDKTYNQQTIKNEFGDKMSKYFESGSGRLL